MITNIKKETQCWWRATFLGQMAMSEICFPGRVDLSILRPCVRRSGPLLFCNIKSKHSHSLVMNMFVTASSPSDSILVGASHTVVCCIASVEFPVSISVADKLPNNSAYIISRFHLTMIGSRITTLFESCCTYVNPKFRSSSCRRCHVALDFSRNTRGSSKNWKDDSGP